MWKKKFSFRYKRNEILWNYHIFNIDHFYCALIIPPSSHKMPRHRAKPRSFHAGLKFPVGRVHRKMKKGRRQLFCCKFLRKFLFLFRSLCQTSRQRSARLHDSCAGTHHGRSAQDHRRRNRQREHEASQCISHPDGIARRPRVEEGGAWSMDTQQLQWICFTLLALRWSLSCRGVRVAGQRRGCRIGGRRRRRRRRDGGRRKREQPGRGRRADRTLEDDKPFGPVFSFINRIVRNFLSVQTANCRFLALYCVCPPNVYCPGIVHIIVVFVKFRICILNVAINYFALFLGVLPACLILPSVYSDSDWK